MTHTALRAATLALAATAFVAGQAEAGFLQIKTGQVSCLDYDPEAKTCASIQRGVALPDGRVALVDETEFFFQNAMFGVATGMIAVPKNGQLCIDPETVTARVDPPENLVAQEFAVEQAVQARVAARMGACVEHLQCANGEHVARFVLDGEPIEGMSMRFRLFEPGAPEIAELENRLMGPAQLAGLADTDISDCTAMK